jgi:glycosyltransferase involved in cell wall biosynthesis
MTVRNGEAHLPDALRSIQRQTYARWEAIVVDDGSSDGSPAIVADFASRDSRVRLVRAPPKGRARASNLGVSLATGELVARLDADDIAVPERLELQVQAMRDPGLDVCGGWAALFGDRSGIWAVPQRHDAIVRGLMIGSGLINPTMIARTGVMKAHPYDERMACEDDELWSRLMMSHRFGNLRAVLIQYRCHPGQATRQERAALRVDRRFCRHRLIRALFPDVSLDDAAALDRVFERTACPNLAELTKAGTVLVRVVAGHDELNAEARRLWALLCGISVPKGPAASELYRRVAAQLGATETELHSSPQVGRRGPFPASLARTLGYRRSERYADAG